jgi:hypothetical protein
MTFLSNKTAELGYEYYNWTDIVDELRHHINHAKKHPKDADMNTYTLKDINMDNPPAFKVGDIVYHKLEVPVDKTGVKLQDARFRQGDVRFDTLHPRKIVQVLAYTSRNPWRYMLEAMPNVSYAEAELLRADEEKGSKYTVREIIGKSIDEEEGVVYYKVWWRGYLKKDATWEPEDELVEDGLQNLITEFENKRKENEAQAIVPAKKKAKKKRKYR